MPVELLAVVIVILSALGAIGLVALVRLGLRGRGTMPGTQDIEGIYVVVLGAFYAVFIAFMIFVVWIRYYDALATTEHEADALATLYRLSGSLPEPMQSDYRRDCVQYARVMIDQEWPDMARDRAPKAGDQLAGRIWRLTDSLTPARVPDAVMRDHVLDAVTTLTSFRRIRLLQSHTSLPSVLYAVLVLGAILIVALACLFTTESFWPHAFKAASLAAIISLMLLAVQQIDYPFQGQVHVDPSAFQRSLEIVEQGS